MKQIVLITIVLSLFLLSGCGKVIESVVQSQPAQAEVERFFEGWKCGPENPTFEDEHNCSEYLRYHSASIKGKITRVVPEESDLYIYTPFDYFSYISGDEDHYYVSVNTKDNGPLIYSSTNGEYMGDYYDLMGDMGCYVSEYDSSAYLGCIMNRTRCFDVNYTYDFQFLDTNRCSGGYCYLDELTVNEIKIKNLEDRPGVFYIELYYFDEDNMPYNGSDDYGYEDATMVSEKERIGLTPYEVDTMMINTEKLDVNAEYWVRSRVYPPTYEKCL